MQSRQQKAGLNFSSKAAAVRVRVRLLASAHGVRRWQIERAQREDLNFVLTGSVGRMWACALKCWLVGRTEKKNTCAAETNEAVHRGCEPWCAAFLFEKMFGEVRKKTSPRRRRSRELGDVAVAGSERITQGRGGPELCWRRVAMKP